MTSRPTSATAAAPTPSSAATSRPTARGRLAAAVRLVLRGVVLRRVAEGRLRNVRWPAGWSGVIAVGYVGFAVSALLVLTAPVWRDGVLVQVGNDIELIPRATVWVFALLVMTVAALFHLGAVHGPWWSKIISLVIMVVLMALWPSLLASTAGWLWTTPGVVCILAMIIFTLVRWAASPRWWELVVFWVLLTVPVVVAMAGSVRFSRPLGFDLTPTIIAQTMTMLALLCVPIAVASGTAVAELTVSATVWVALAAGRLSRRPLLLALLALAFAVRAVQTAFDVRELDPSWSSVLPAATCVALIVAASALLLRRAGSAALGVTGLPDELTRVAIPIGATLLGVLVPYSLLLFGLQIRFTVTGSAELGAWGTALSGEGAGALMRGLLVAALVVLAVRSAGRRRLPVAVLQAHIAIFLLPTPVGALTQASFPLLPDPDLLNVFVTVLAVVLLGWCLATRSLTGPRITALGALVVLAAVFSGRDVVLTPLSWVFGPSARLILVGLVWTLLTGCDRANVDGRRFSATSRAAMMIGFVMLTGVVLAYYTLAGSPSQGTLDIAASLGDAVLGTALLTATVTLLVVQIRTDRPLA